MIILNLASNNHRSHYFWAAAEWFGAAARGPIISLDVGAAESAEALKWEVNFSARHKTDLFCMRWNDRLCFEMQAGECTVRLVRFFFSMYYYYGAHSVCVVCSFNSRSALWSFGFIYYCQVGRTVQRNRTADNFVQDTRDRRCCTYIDFDHLNRLHAESQIASLIVNVITKLSGWNWWLNI